MTPRTHQNTSRTHQNTSDHTRTHPEHMQHHHRTRRGTWIHVDSPNLIDLTWLSLKPKHIILKAKLARRTVPGDQRDERHRGDVENPKIHQEMSKSSPGPTRRFQKQSRKHQRCSRSSQNNFLCHFTTKSSTDAKGTHDRARARAGGLIELQNPSDRIMHAGTIEISRLSHPPTSELV